MARMARVSSVRTSVRPGTGGGILEALVSLRHSRWLRTAATLGLIVLGPLLAVATYLVFGPFDQAGSVMTLRLVLLADLVYVLVLAALVMSRIAQMIAARRARSAGSRLHLRLTVVFAGLALMPTVLVAVFAALTVNMGLEGWFSERVRSVVGSSLEAAQAYEREHREGLAEDAEALARYLARRRAAGLIISTGALRQELTQGQSLIQRGLAEAFVIDGAGNIVARGERSYLFDYEPPSEEDIRRAAEGETVIIEDWANDEFRALVALPGFFDRFLYVSRRVDGDLLALLDETQQTAQLYHQLESERGRVLFEFGLLYLGFAVIMILAAIWLGLWFAERLSRPVGRLAGAVQRVGAGDLDVRVEEERSDDEIAMLGRIFNQMTRQLKLQRDALLDAHAQTERRRRLFDSVLSSVTAGVVALDAAGRVTLVNRAAERLLGLDAGVVDAPHLAVLVPEFGPLLARLMQGGAESVQEEVKLVRGGKQENLLVRMSARRAEDGTLEGYVVTFDDVTDLVAAQRMAAWGDVARRIAHEIKNPLTPIKLSAERLRRRLSRKLDEADAEVLEGATDVIVRQTDDLRRIVDEFSRFARMPEPDRRRQELNRLVRDAAMLQEAGLPHVRLEVKIPEEPLWADVDDTMISQALTNLLKNAGEAIESIVEKEGLEDYPGEIRLRLGREGDAAVITIEDNGIGLPEDRARLFEPYVTTREKGTGLGLPIVKKIIEEHGGTLTLEDAAPFAEGARRGARAVIRLALAADALSGAQNGGGRHGTSSRNENAPDRNAAV
ncbi:two-component system, NtrC family, nitrogen regulation sensor histidine kinase NtrY [Meinhardsimonia xiamenensis]|jgi:two-component system nitrogen regulation sensor histidine kinase NtrY|uniref:histidine kinase n=2 Tax=Meinhardsimonia xiamenensis TaxID=990712 RepID=A0A1G9GP50_9RHOB|nr:two-component system nitrogen regulation sensor histidine kinase NtrY [Meinhardsimonia xiamenensis]SDL02436.1 two-component system, NtrC family, nitrogen regulation sensor histidine kinase NtrY [Meinhardsimonia xiamenensis]